MTSGLNDRNYLEVTGLHPGHESINESPDVLAVQGVVLILEIVDDVPAHRQLLLGVGAGQVGVELVQA